MPFEIKDWAEIADDGYQSILLGNGASIALDPCFAYSSLLDAARDEGRITPSLEQIFDYLDTVDFEYVLNMLWHTYHINQALEIEDNASTDAYQDIRSALIETVRERHLEFTAAEPHLETIADFLANFRTVVSLNYDLVVYWAMLRGNEERGRWFKDGFVDDNAFDRNWKRLREPYNTRSVSFVAYPHGNLAIASRLLGNDIKIHRRGQYLLDSIAEEWQAGRSVPLFVAEGDSKQKLLAIMRSEYLSVVFDEVLFDLGNSVVCYGWAAKDNDKHILDRIVRGGVEKLAFSIRASGRDSEDIQQKCAEIAARVRAARPRPEIVFFEAESPGCWITPTEDQTSSED